MPIPEIETWSLDLDDFTERVFDWLERHNKAGHHKIFAVNAYKQTAAQQIADSLVSLIMELMDKEPEET